MKAVQPSQSSSASGSSIETIGMAGREVREERDHLLGGPVRPLEVVAAVLEDLGRWRDPSRARPRPPGSRPARSIACTSSVERLVGRPDLGREPALVADAGATCRPRATARAARGSSSVPQRSASANEAAPTGITMNSWSSRALSACTPPFSTFIIGDRQYVGVRAAEVAVERLPAGIRGRLRDREGDAEDRVRAQGALVRGAVEVDERAIDAALRERIEPAQRLGDRTVHVRDGVQHALAARRARGHRPATRSPRAHRWRPRRGRPRARTRRRPARRRPRRWGCRANRGSRGRGRPRSATWPIDATGRSAPGREPGDHERATPDPSTTS